MRPGSIVLWIGCCAALAGAQVPNKPPTPKPDPVPVPKPQPDFEEEEPTVDPKVEPQFWLMGPRKGKAQQRAAKQYGADTASEKAVAAGLEWLVRHQDEDGLFDPDGFPEECVGDEPCDGIGKGQHGEEVACPFDHAITAMATLAFLGRGHVPGDKEDAYGGVVERALIALRAADDRFGIALSTEAFAEAEVLEGKGRWKDDVDRGVAILLQARQADGAFGYAAPWRRGSDVPYTALVVEALVTARDAGAALPHELARDVDEFLDTLEVKKGRLAYLVDGRAYGYTPTTTNGHLAAAIRELLDVDLQGDRHESHLALIARSLPSWKVSFKTVDVDGVGTVEAQVGDLSLYQWYYGNLATFLSSPSKFRDYFTAVKRELLANQQKRGCAKGSWNPEGTYERQTGGRVMATALAVLMLEQPYRHKRRP